MNICECGDIDHPEGARALANRDLTNPCGDRRHRPPIIGVEHSIQLVARFPPRIV
jgi:hypothetical protein